MSQINVIPAKESTRIGLAKRDDIHILRKLWHMSSGSLGLYIYINYLPEQQLWGFIALAIAIFGISLDLTRVRVPKLNAVVVKLMGPLMRNSEHSGVSGMPFYALGVALSLLLFNEKIAILSILFLVFSDPISSFFGVCYGKDKILPNKSVQGCAAGFVTCFILTGLFTATSGASVASVFIFSVIAGLIGSTSEVLSAFGIDDNLTIPVFSGIGLTIVNYMMQVI
jgi:diacylglycerol kinase (CTP)